MAGERQRLCNETLPNARAALPEYDRARLSTGVVHLGIGAFHRAHQAVYFDTVLQSEPEWGITGVSLRNTEVARAPAMKGLRYLVKDEEGVEQWRRFVEAMLRSLESPSGP